MLHAVYRVGNLDETLEYYKKHFGLKQLRYRDIPEVQPSGSAPWLPARVIRGTEEAGCRRNTPTPSWGLATSGLTLLWSSRMGLQHPATFLCSC